MNQEKLFACSVVNLSTACQLSSKVCQLLANLSWQTDGHFPSRFPCSFRAGIFLFLSNSSHLPLCGEIPHHWARIDTVKIAERRWLSLHPFVRRQFNFEAPFFFKNRKIEADYFDHTPTYGGTPLSWWQGPPLFPFGLFPTMGITIQQGTFVSCQCHCGVLEMSNL